MTGEMIVLSVRAQNRLMVLSALDRGKLRMREAAQVLGISVRHLRRLRGRYHRRGASGLVHGNRGRPSPRRLSDAVRLRLVTLARRRYAGVNFQHLTELLAEREGLRVSRTSLRRVLGAAGLRSPRPRRAPRHRRRRERMPHPGMLVQLDGSQHAWLEDRGPRLVLLAAIDDATGQVLGATFRQQEDAQGYLLLLRHLAQRHGLPLAIYSDRHSIFQPAKQPRTLLEQLQGQADPTQVGRVLHTLSIRWIPAASPQAKGRIERLFGALQDRLVTELRLAQVTDRDAANRLLPRFLAHYNRRFAQPPAQPHSLFRPWPAGLVPREIFCFHYYRVVANDNTVTVGPHRLQLLPSHARASYARARVEIREYLDGTLGVFAARHTVRFQRLNAPPPGDLRVRGKRRAEHVFDPPPPSPTRPPGLTPAPHPWHPPSTHPWRELAARAVKRKALLDAGVSFSLAK